MDVCYDDSNFDTKKAVWKASPPVCINLCVRMRVRAEYGCNDLWLNGGSFCFHASQVVHAVLACMCGVCE